MLHLQKPLGFLLRTQQKQKRKLIKTSAHKGACWQNFGLWQFIDCSSSTLFCMLTLLSSADTDLKYLKSEIIWTRKYENVRPACGNFHCQVALAIYCWQINMTMLAKKVTFSNWSVFKTTELDVSVLRRKKIEMQFHFKDKSFT